MNEPIPLRRTHHLSIATANELETAGPIQVFPIDFYLFSSSGLFRPINTQAQFYYVGYTEMKD
jgi:hypothetical protein